MINWPIKKLTDLCDLQRGTEPGSASYVEQSNDALPFLRVGDLSGKVDALKFVAKNKNKLQIVDKNETLITFDGTPGIVIRGLSGAIASGVRVIKNLKPGINNDFLFYYLQTPIIQKTIKAYSKGATIIHASAAIPHLKIPLPTVGVQKKIVERLDKIVEAQKLNDELVAKTDELFQSLLHKELNPVGKDWEVKKLGEVCEIARGGSPRPISKYLTNDSDGINWIKIGDVEEGEKYIIATEQKIKSAGVSKTRLVKEGDFILSNSMSFGRPYILKISGAIHDGWLLVRINDKKALSQDFLFYILGTAQTKIQFEKSASGGVVRNLNTNLVKKIKIVVPELIEQKKIVAKLGSVQDYKKQLVEQKAKLKELFDSVLAKSMSGEL